MRVTADHLVDDGPGDVVKGEGALFLRHPGVEDHLEEEVAQLVAQVGQVAPLDGVGHFIGLFDGVGGDGGEGLLQVPGAAVLRVAEAGHDVEELLQGQGLFRHRVVSIRKGRAAGRRAP